MSDFRANSATLIRQVRETGRPLVLTQRGRPTAVVVGVGQYQALLDEVAELKDISRGLADVAQGQVTSHAEVVAELLGDPE